VRRRIAGWSNPGGTWALLAVITIFAVIFGYVYAIENGWIG
jgi:hypothetical protein